MRERGNPYLEAQERLHEQRPSFIAQQVWLLAPIKRFFRVLRLQLFFVAQRLFPWTFFRIDRATDAVDLHHQTQLLCECDGCVAVQVSIVRIFLFVAEQWLNKKARFPTGVPT